MGRGFSITVGGQLQPWHRITYNILQTWTGFSRALPLNPGCLLPPECLYTLPLDSNHHTNRLHPS
ncbi:hypothetical protein C0J52_11084 [Blattella germanica]|nr:hypothetical protein C0J52_11084 [Blattella germanica]